MRRVVSGTRQTAVRLVLCLWVYLAAETIGLAALAAVWRGFARVRSVSSVTRPARGPARRGPRLEWRRRALAALGLE